MEPLLQKNSRKTCGESILKYQTEVEVEFHVEEKAAEIKNQVQTVKNSPDAQQHQAATALKEVAEMQRECKDSVKVCCKGHTN